jgi:hypothetical protein
MLLQTIDICALDRVEDEKVAKTRNSLQVRAHTRIIFFVVHVVSIWVVIICAIGHHCTAKIASAFDIIEVE